MNQTSYGVSPVNLESKSKGTFCYSLPRKKISFSHGNFRLFPIKNFKNRSFSSVKQLFK